MNFFRLGDIADIFRCQLRDSANAPEVRTIQNGCIDPLTGIVDASGGYLRHMEAAGTRYALKPLDTVMVFYGSSGSLGFCGIVPECRETLVPAASLCAIRAERIDPVWLFTALRGMKDELQELGVHRKTESGRLLPSFLSLDELRELKIREPSEEEIGRVNAMWGGIVEMAEKRKALERKIAETAAEIDAIHERSEK